MPTLLMSAFHYADNLDKEIIESRLIKCLPIFEQFGLFPWAALSGGKTDVPVWIFGGTALVHKEFAKQTGDPFWGAGFMYIPAPKAKALTVTMSVPDSSPDGPLAHWTWLTSLTEKICIETEAELGMINGFSIKKGDLTSGGTPSNEDVAPGKPISICCPWMYWGNKWTSEPGFREKMEQLSDLVFRNQPSGKEGWVLSFQKEYSGEKPDSFLSSYAELWNLEKVRWAGVK